MTQRHIVETIQNSMVEAVCAADGDFRFAAFRTAYKLVDMGAVMSNDTSVGLNADLLTLDNLSARTIQIQTKYLMTWGEEGISYAVRIINIPVENEDTIIYARPYYTVEMDGKPVTVYGDIYKDNYVGKIDVNDGVLEW